MGRAYGALAIISLALVSPLYAAAHKPLDSTDNTNYDTATVIPDHRVSWAIYQELKGQNSADFYRFEGRQDERFYMQMTVPDIGRHRDFEPSVALVGTGLNGAALDLGENTVDTVLDSNETGFNTPSASEALVLDYDNRGTAERFFEPFTQTLYIVRQELVIDSLPKTGTYTLVVYDRTLQLGESGKYVLAVGEREDFSAVDYFTTLPAAWFETKLFFEDYASIGIAITAFAGAIVLVLLLVMRRAGIIGKLRTRRYH